jgi:hypothetical protein
MRVLFGILLVALLLVLAGSSLDRPRAAAAEYSAEESEQTRGGESEQQPGSEPLETFVPSEKLSADRAASFPVDI